MNSIVSSSVCPNLSSMSPLPSVSPTSDSHAHTGILFLFMSTLYDHYYFIRAENTIRSVDTCRYTGSKCFMDPDVISGRSRLVINFIILRQSL